MSFFVGFEAQRYTIVAIAQPGRLGAIFKDMAVVTAAICAVILRALHKQFAVQFRFERILDRGKETWPTSAAVEFHFGLEQRMSAAGADEYAFAVFIVERAGEAALRTFLPQYMVLFGSQRVLPPVVGFFRLARHMRYCIRVGASNRASWQGSGYPDHESGHHVPSGGMPNRSQCLCSAQCADNVIVRKRLGNSVQRSKTLTVRQVVEQGGANGMAARPDFARQRVSRHCPLRIVRCHETAPEQRRTSQIIAGWCEAGAESEQRACRSDDTVNVLACVG